MPRALPASVRAGRAAAAASAPSAAQRHFELALELWNQVPDAEERAGIDHPQLLEAAAAAASRAGQSSRGLALVDEALAEVGRGRVSRSAAPTCSSGGASCSATSDATTRAWRCSSGRSALLPPDATESDQRAGSRLVRPRWFAASTRSSARRDGRRAWAQRGGRRVEVKLEAQIVLVPSMVYGGDVDPAWRSCVSRARKAGAPGCSWLATRAFINLADLQLMLGRYEDAVRSIDEGMPLAEQAGLERTPESSCAATRPRRSCGRDAGMRPGGCGTRRRGPGVYAARCCCFGPSFNC